MTIARAFTDTFTGIDPAHAPSFIVAQLLGAVAASFLFGWLFGKAKENKVKEKRPRRERRADA